jgi:hypothetical protein
MTNLAWLQRWYLSQCNDAWEHGYGVHIGTLDNPGWTVDIDLRDTPYQNISLEVLFKERSEDDWVHCSIKEQKFQGRCGPENLDELLQVFRDQIDANQPRS